MSDLVHIPAMEIAPGHQILGFDTETFLIAPGVLAPRMVCLSGARRVGEGVQSGVVLREQGLAWLHSALARPDVTLIAHNAPYDAVVAMADAPSLILPIFEAYRSGRIECTLIKQQVIDVALGMRKFRRVGGVVSRASYGLADLVSLYYGRRLEKDDTWRLRYAVLDDVPVQYWPSEARDYAELDAVEALMVWEAQEREIAELWPSGGLPNQTEQQMASLALHLMSAWGIRAERSAVGRFIAQCEEKIREMEEALDGSGIFKLDKAGKPLRTATGAPQRIMKEIMRRVVESLETMRIAIPRTPTGLPVTDKDTLLLTDDPELHVLAESMSYAKHLGQWGPVLSAAVERPVVCRYGVLMETGRTSASGSEGQEGTNIQNPPRDGDVRPCVVPRPGWCFVSTDADTIELRAHAQNMLDLGIRDVRLAETLVRQHRDGGPDAHETLAAGIMGIEPDEVQRLVKVGDKPASDARQFAKIPGYGFPGGLGARVFVAYAAGQLKKADFVRWFHSDVRDGETPRAAAERKAAQIRETWFETFPENREYFAIVNRMIGDNRSATIQQLMSNRIRGDVRYAAICNGFFQGRVADAMKEVLFWLAYECYTGQCFEQHRHGGDHCGASGRSVLAGSRPVMFLHDEPILEHPVAQVHERAARQQYAVVTTLNKWMPDIPCASTAVALYRWHKGAKPTYRDGRLVPSRPQKDENGRTRWVEDTEPAHVIMPAGARSPFEWASTLYGRLRQYEAAKQQMVMEVA